MGRGMLIAVTLVVVVYGIVSLNIQQNSRELVRNNANNARNILARNAAYSGLELTINQLKDHDWDYQAMSSNITYDLGDTKAEIQLNTPSNSSMKYNLIRVVAVGKAGDVTSRISSVLKTNMPTPHGAMAFYGNNDVSFNANGNAFQINGHDTGPGGASGTAPSVPGIATQNNNSYQGFKNGLKHSQKDNIKGKGPVPSMEMDPTMSPGRLQQNVDHWTNHPDNVIGTAGGGKKGSKGTKKMNSVQWGDEDEPEVTVINEDVELAGNSGGYGILVLKEDATLTVKGNFNYKGIILSNGKDMAIDAKGNTKVYGSMIGLPDKDCGTTKTDCEMDVNFSGNIDIFYSNESLMNTQSGLSNQLDVTYERVSMYE